jgi:hypothetical protein
MKDLIGRGYTGMFSIEPHILAQVHLDSASTGSTDPQKMYLEYGRQANRLLDTITGR